MNRTNITDVWLGRVQFLGCCYRQHWLLGCAAVSACMSALLSALWHTLGSSCLQRKHVGVNQTMKTSIQYKDSFFYCVLLALTSLQMLCLLLFFLTLTSWRPALFRKELQHLHCNIAVQYTQKHLLLMKSTKEVQALLVDIYRHCM